MIIGNNNKLQASTIASGKIGIAFAWIDTLHTYVNNQQCQKRGRPRGVGNKFRVISRKQMESEMAVGDRLPVVHHQKFWRTKDEVYREGRIAGSNHSIHRIVVFVGIISSVGAAWSGSKFSWRLFFAFFLNAFGPNRALVVHFAFSNTALMTF